MPGFNAKRRLKREVNANVQNRSVAQQINEILRANGVQIQNISQIPGILEDLFDQRADLLEERERLLLGGPLPQGGAIPGGGSGLALEAEDDLGLPDFDTAVSLEDSSVSVEGTHSLDPAGIQKKLEARLERANREGVSYGPPGGGGGGSRRNVTRKLPIDEQREIMGRVLGHEMKPPPPNPTPKPPGF